MGRNFDSQEPIGKAIRAVRKARGMKQAELGERCGLAPASLSQIENRGWNLTLRNLTEICAGLGVRLSELLAIAEASDARVQVAEQPAAFDSAEDVLSPPFLGRAIREAMALRAMTAPELTRRTGFTSRTVDDAVTGTGTSSIGTVLRIADVLDVGHAELFSRAEALQSEAGDDGGAGDRSSA